MVSSVMMAWAFRVCVPHSHLTRNKRHSGPSLHVDNKWVSSSKEIITFRKALLNPITSFQFRRFVSLKGDLLENGVIFWQEVQKYKDMCHSHCDDDTLQNKITTIIKCFITSTIPPALQIDIPEEQAQKIVEQRKELGPYVFREAQMTIFALLFKFWPKFCEFRSNLVDEDVLALLETQRKMEKQRKAGIEEAIRKKSVASVKSFSTADGKTKSDLSSTPSFTGYGRQEPSNTNLVNLALPKKAAVCHSCPWSTLHCVLDGML
uniref:Regulator of G-protein signaling 22 n=1 Tax=Sphaerodactylus townsendi TaxID=933632 RepID=A0ACB8FEU5_9SAUR